MVRFFTPTDGQTDRLTDGQNRLLNPASHMHARDKTGECHYAFVSPIPSLFAIYDCAYLESIYIIVYIFLSLWLLRCSYK